MKNIEVSGAIIIKDCKIFVTQRGYGEFKDMWEFPGGKLEAGETPEQAIVREIKEELDADITPIKNLGFIEYDYPTFHLKMHCIVCELHSEFKLLEHESAKWVSAKNIDTVGFLPADVLVINSFKNYFDSILNCSNK